MTNVINSGEDFATPEAPNWTRGLCLNLGEKMETLNDAMFIDDEGTERFHVKKLSEHTPSDFWIYDIAGRRSYVLKSGGEVAASEDEVTSEIPSEVEVSADVANILSMKKRSL